MCDLKVRPLAAKNKLAGLGLDASDVDKFQLYERLKFCVSFTNLVVVLLR